MIERRPSADQTRMLLLCGAAAGPLYVVVGVLEVVFREGFDIRRHALSLMSNGRYGWIQMASFIISGILVVAGSIGARRVLVHGRGSTWGPRLLALYGLGLIAAGIFVADPMDGFPPGTPPGPPAVVSWHGPLHFVAGGIGFIGLIASCLVFARRFAGEGNQGWAVFSAATGILFLLGFAGVASGSKEPVVIRVFTCTVVLVWVWISALSLLLMKRLAQGAQRLDGGASRAQV